ncbi:hypothetical protein [Rhizobium sp. 11515TR]|uniref:hypothetical protein n=1 Tax=Rhizobium sp. 11515TR TaxID=2028343 RepID=UPI000BA87E6D|nr:hypothetical protein [Rhizobium sp. 11515TR]ASW09972.1 hypothetical protein CKA34_28605 [Rhizobium sp. 11515TR]
MSLAADIGAIPPSVPVMKLIHTTSVTNFRSMCASESLVPQLCPVMCEELTYYFYGRPAYRPGKLDINSQERDARAVCLIFKRASINSVVGIYPCDTGAHGGSLYAPYLDGVTFADMNCASISDAEGRIVSRFFDNNEDYFYGLPVEALTPAANATAAAYHTMLSSLNNTKLDDRSRSIEVVQDSTMPLLGALEAIIAPDFLRADPDVSPFLDKLLAGGVNVEFRRAQTLTNAAKMVEAFFPEVARFQGIAI